MRARERTCHVRTVFCADCFCGADLVPTSDRVFVEVRL
jgi:hypothetical protein